MKRNENCASNGVPALLLVRIWPNVAARASRRRRKLMFGDQPFVAAPWKLGMPHVVTAWALFPSVEQKLVTLEPVKVRFIRLNRLNISAESFTCLPSPTLKPF